MGVCFREVPAPTEREENRDLLSREGAERALHAGTGSDPDEWLGSR